MSELELLQKRIDISGTNGIETAHIRDDYEPAGNLMIKSLSDSGEYVQRKSPPHSFDAKWRIVKKGNEPY